MKINIPLLAQDINAVQVVVSLVDHHHGPPLGNVRPLRSGDHQDGLVKVDKWKCVHRHVRPHVLLQQLRCNVLK